MISATEWIPVSERPIEFPAIILWPDASMGLLKQKEDCYNPSHWQPFIAPVEWGEDWMLRPAVVNKLKYIEKLEKEFGNGKLAALLKSE